MTDDALTELLGKATPGPWRSPRIGKPERVSNEADCRLIALAPDLAREVIALRAEVADYRDAAELALEYWAHRMQRYKNRAPVWVQKTRAALTPTTSDKDGL